jgi:hypothetical protein
LVQYSFCSTANGPALFGWNLTASGCGIVSTTLVELLAVYAFFAVVEPFIVFWIVASTLDEVVKTLIEEVVVEDLPYSEQFSFVSIGHCSLLASVYVL